MARITWSQRQDIGPSARSGAALAFDAGRSRTVLFGGRGTAGADGETWEWNGAHWTQAQDSGPAARDTAAMAHGSDGVVLFGGFLDVATSGSFRAGDTWSWGGQDWTQLNDTGPSPRNRACLVYDAARARYVLFGGAGDQGEFGDTWTFDASQWTQVADTGPSPRIGHAMAYDVVNERVVLFGGQSNGVASNETWSWDGVQWTQAQDVGPSARAGHVMAADAGSVWLFGGGTSLTASGGDLLGDSWEWSGSTWTQRQDIGPRPRIGAGFAFDSVRDRIVLFGGLGDGAGPGASGVPVGDTWEALVTPGSDPGVPNADTFTVDASKAMVAGSDLGYVTVVAAVAAPADRMVSVLPDGGAVFGTVAAIRAGETTGRAFFALTYHSPGPLVVGVTMGASTVTATVDVVVNSGSMRALTISPTSIARGGAVTISVRAPFASGPQVVAVISLTTGLTLWQVFVPPARNGLTSVAEQVPLPTPVGSHTVVAIVDDFAWAAAAGYFEITIT